MISIVLSMDSLAAALPPSSQPFGTEEGVSRMLDAACGETSRETLGVGDDVDGVWCTGFIDADQARIQLVFTDADTTETRPDASSEATLEAVGTEDLAYLVGLGFDESEFENPVTREIVVTDEDGSGGLVKSYLGTMTFVDRAVGDHRVPGHRVVLMRDTKGALAMLTAHWPAFDTITPVVGGTSALDEGTYAKLLGVDTAAVRQVFPVLVVDGVAEGAVGAARELVAVVVSAAGPQGGQVWVARYFDGTDLVEVGDK